jgi:hypothetical protein
MFFCSLFLKGTTNRQTGIIRGKSIITVFLNSKHEKAAFCLFDVEKNRRALL